MHSGVRCTGRGGRFGSTLGLLVGMGLGKLHIFPFTCTQMLGGNSSPCSALVSSCGQKIFKLSEKYLVTNLAEAQLDLVEIVELGAHPDVAVAGDVGGLLGAQHELELRLLEPRAS